MKINLLKGSLSYGLVTIFSRVANIFLIPVFTRILSPEEYGLLNIVISLTALANLVVGLEIAQAVTLYFNDRSRINRNLYPSTAFVFLIAIYFFLIIFVLLFGNIILSIYKDFGNVGSSIFIYGTMLLSVNGVFFFMQNQLRLEFLTKQFAIFTIAYVLFTGIGSLGGAYLSQNRLEGVILGQVIGALIIDLVGLMIFWRIFTMGFESKKLTEMLKYSLPLVLSGLLILGGQQLPKLILIKYGILEDVGIFALASQIAGFAGLSVLGVQTAITPAILVNHQAPETPIMLGRLFEKFSIIGLLFCAFLSIFARELVTLFSTPDYYKAASFVPYLSVALVLNSLYIFFPGKIISRKSSAQLVASGGSFIVAAVAGVFLVKIDGIRGAAMSSLLSAIAFLSIWCCISQKLFNIIVNWFKLIKSIILVVILCFTTILLFPLKITSTFILIKCILLGILMYLIAWEFMLELYKIIGLKIRNTVVKVFTKHDAKT